MKLVDIERMSTLNDPLTREVFREVVQSRRIKRKDLVDRMSERGRDGQMIGESLLSLERTALVEKIYAPIDAFTTYVVTADGLRVSRESGM